MRHRTFESNLGVGFTDGAIKVLADLRHDIDGYYWIILCGAYRSYKPGLSVEIAFEPTPHPQAPKDNIAGVPIVWYCDDDMMSQLRNVVVHMEADRVPKLLTL